MNLADHKIAAAIGAVGIAIVLGHVVVGPDVVPPFVAALGAPSPVWRPCSWRWPNAVARTGPRLGGRTMIRARSLALAVGVAAAAGAASALVRHVRGASREAVPGGIIIGDAAVYDAASRLVLGSFSAGSPPTSRGSPGGLGCSRSGVAPAIYRSGWPATTAWR